jgi:hypothetical protein
VVRSRWRGRTGDGPSLWGSSTTIDSVSSTLYGHAATTLGPPIALGALALWNRLGSARLATQDASTWMIVGGLLIYVGGAVFDRPQAGRVLPLVLLVASIEVGRWFARMEAAHRSAIVATAAVALIVGGLVVTHAGAIRMVPSALLPARVTTSSQWSPIVDRYSWVADELDEGSVLVSMEWGRELTFSGIRRVVPAWEPNLLDDVEERRAVRALMLASDTEPEQRSELLDAWDVDAAIVARSQGDLIADLLAVGGEVIAERNGSVLISFPP